LKVEIYSNVTAID